jgi:hypothetical protein
MSKTMHDNSSTSSAERQLGRLFGWTGLVIAFASAVIAAVDGERTWMVGWLGSSLGWLLAGLCCMSLGDARARYLTAEAVEETRKLEADASQRGSPS